MNIEQVAVVEQVAMVVQEKAEKVKKLLILPTAIHKEHPLYIGYVGKDE